MYFQTDKKTLKEAEKKQVDDNEGESEAKPEEPEENSYSKFKVNELRDVEIKKGDSKLSNEPKILVSKLKFNQDILMLITKAQSYSSITPHNTKQPYYLE